MHMHHLCEVKKQALPLPTPRGPTQGLAERHAFGLSDVGPPLPLLASLPPPAPAQGLGGASLVALDFQQRVPSGPAGERGL